jgi:hypothetical protein
MKEHSYVHYLIKHLIYPQQFSHLNVREISIIRNLGNALI